MKHLETNATPDESQTASTKELSDQEFAELADRIGEELVRNLNRHVLEEQAQDEAQK